MAHDVFVSYSTKDQDTADSVVASLEKIGINCWYAPRNIQPSDDWGRAVTGAIESSKVFLLIFSGNAHQSQRVLDELNIAITQKATIFPFRIENLEPEGAMKLHLSSRHWLNAFDPSWQSYINQLVKDVSRCLVAPISIEPVEASASRKSSREVICNPFTFGNPIRDRERFIGREEEIRQVTNRLLSSARESTSIVGERRIGKTSLLKHLADPDAAAKFGLDPKEFCLVYIDFQGLNDITPQRFWQRVLSLMARTMGDHQRREAFTHFSQLEHIDLFDLEDVFDSVSRDGTHVVLLMDEFEYVTQNPNFGSDFFGGLRSLAIHYNLSLVPATRRELVELCHSEEIKGSPFFNIFATVVLKPFTQEETDRLITSYSRTAGIQFTDEEIRFIHETGGGYPFFVQMICHYLVAGMEAGLEGDGIMENALEEFNRQAEPHFAYIWSRASDSEKTTLVTLLSLLQAVGNAEKELPVTSVDKVTQIYPRAPRDISTLEKSGSVIGVDGGIALFSSSYAKWIESELSAPPGEQEADESAEQWLISNFPDQAKGADAAKGKLIKTKKKYWPIVGRVYAHDSLTNKGTG